MFIKSFWKSVVLAIIILFLSCTPGNKFDKITFWDILHIDKIAHFIMYFVLTIYLIHGFDKFGYKKKLYNFPIILSIAYGGIIEIIQANFILNRNGDIIDFLFNSLGAIVALLLFTILEKKKLIL